LRQLFSRAGREIYREAFNSAWGEYADKDERRGDESLRKRRTRSPGQQ
jgi:cation transport regulator